MKLPVERWSLLAGLRFLLASVVLCTHLGLYAGQPWASALGKGGFEAIMGFLLISGYSIGSSYTSRPEGFYLRRVERIYPAYSGALLLNLWALGWPGAGVLAANLFFLNQLATSSSWLGPAWSLSLEIWLYALTPLIARLGTRTLWLLIAASFACYLGYVVARPIFHLPPFMALGFGANLVLLSFPWLAGFVLGTAPRQGRTLLVICVGLAAHIGLGYFLQGAWQAKHGRLDDFLAADTPLYVWRGAILALVAAAFLAIVRGRVGRHRSRALNLLGDISYPMYLVHVPIFVIALHHGVSNPLALIALAIGGAAAAVALLEYPIRRLRPGSKPSAIAAIQRADEQALQDGTPVR